MLVGSYVPMSLSCRRSTVSKTLRGNRIPLPTTNQQKNYTCGPAVLSSIFSYWGVSTKEADLAEELKSDPIGGTSPYQLNKAAKSRGFKTIWREKMTNSELKRCLNVGRPVIITVQAWASTPEELAGDSGHYVIAIDYDDKKVYFEDPALNGCRGFIPWSELHSRWHDKDKNGKCFNRFGLVMWKDSKPVKEAIVAGSVFINYADAPFLKEGYRSK